MRLYPHLSCYLLLAALGLFDCLVILSTNISIDEAKLLSLIWPLLPLLAVLFLIEIFKTKGSILPRWGTTTACFVQGVLFLQLGWITVRLFNHLTTRLAAEIGYVDQTLVALDAALMPFWMAYFETVSTMPHVLAIMEAGYTSLSSLSAIAFLVIFAFYGVRRSQYFVETFFLTAVACTAMGLFFPALGAVATFLPDTFDFTAFPSVPGLWAVESMEALRSGDALTLDVDRLPGLVTFPSFHTASGIILMASFRRTRFFLPVCAYAAVMISATPIFGGHYFIDLLGGALVALCVATWVARRERFAGLFADTQEAAMASPSLAVR